MGLFGKKKVANFAQKVSAVAQSAGLKVLESHDNLVVSVFTTEGGRIQKVLFVPMGELAGCNIVGIFSVAAEISGEIDPNLAVRLLKENGNHKVGYWGVIEGKDKTLIGIHHDMVLETFDPEEFRVVVPMLAILADQLEKELSPGTDKF